MKVQLKKIIFSAKVKSVSFMLIAFLSGIFLTSFYIEKSYKEKITVSGFPILQYDSFSLTYDSRNKVPLWTYEHLTQKSLNGSISRKDILFSEDPSIYKLHRSSLKDYYQSGFDRGHMVPAGDQQHSKVALKNTFYLTNICPQNACLNRGLWASLEKQTRNFLKENQDIEVITGPLFLPHKEGNKRYVTYQVIGKNNVAVPTHFFKLIQTNQGRTAYIIPNESIDKEMALNNFEVSIETLERVSGLQFKFKS